MSSFTVQNPICDTVDPIVSTLRTSVVGACNGASRTCVDVAIRAEGPLSAATAAFGVTTAFYIVKTGVDGVISVLRIVRCVKLRKEGQSCYAAGMEAASYGLAALTDAVWSSVFGTLAWTTSQAPTFINATICPLVSGACEVLATGLNATCSGAPIEISVQALANATAGV